LKQRDAAGQAIMNTPRAFSFAAVLAIATAIGGYAALRAAQAPHGIAAGNRPVWIEVGWPFPLDQWGRGRAFRCNAAICGSEINLYLRAKIGFCNCASAIDDEEVDRVGDVDLVGDESVALGPGRPIRVHWMKGRSRSYAIGNRGGTAKSALVIVFHDRCDMIVATAAVGNNEPTRQEDAVLEFLNSNLVLRWSETTLGL
jgi:hypothetical protein